MDMRWILSPFGSSTTFSTSYVVVYFVYITTK